MATEGSASFCVYCGDALQKGDKFCGYCGAAVLPPAPQAEQMVAHRTPASAAGAPVAWLRRVAFLTIVAAAVVVLLVVGGALAYLGNGFGVANAPPDPAFDLPLQALTNLTDAPIMLPAKLPNELKNVGVDENVGGDSYGVVFLYSPPDDLVGTWPRLEVVGYLRAVPESKDEPDRLRKATSTENVRLPDGTEAQLRYMEPVGEVANYGPQWEGTFNKDGYTYTLSTSLEPDGEAILAEALSSMVAVER